MITILSSRKAPADLAALDYQQIRAALIRQGVNPTGVQMQYWEECELFNPQEQQAEIEHAQFVLVRSVWNYHCNAVAFRDFIQKAAAALAVSHTRMQNEPHLILWNMDKHYLEQLSEHGIRTVPTVYIEVDQVVSEMQSRQKLCALCRDRKWSHIVVKPAVSANSYLTMCARVDCAQDMEAAADQVMRILRQGNCAAMVQPFCSDVATYGEVSLIYLDGEYSHAIRKIITVSTDDTCSQVVNPASSTLSSAVPHSPTDSQLSFAQQVLRTACDLAVPPSKCLEPPLVARIDMINTDKPTLLELELIEPFLYASDDSSDRLASAIIARNR